MSKDQPQTNQKPDQPAKPDQFAKPGMPVNKVKQAKPADAAPAKTPDTEQKRRY